MTTSASFFTGLLVLCGVAVATWIVSVIRRNAAIVDSLWSLFFLIAGVTYFAVGGADTARAWLVLAMVSAWALRLSAYITWRNWGKPEDFRYQAMRERHDSGFALKSLYIVFLLQAAIAWIVSLPLLGAVQSTAALGPLDVLGVALFAVGLFFEAVGDFQMARFKANPDNRGKVMNRGLWRYTRHPNYFGDFSVWWGLYLIAVSAGAWWALPGPLLMSFLLLKVSGVALLEKDIAERRPKYADYIRTTNAFFPGLPRTATTTQEAMQ